MKIKKALVTLGLALTLGLGVGAGLSVKNNSEVKEAKAADSYQLSGDFNSWGETEMTDSDGDGVFTATVTLEAAKGLKVKQNHSWDTAYGTGNVLYHTPGAFADGSDQGNIYVKTAGTYTVYVHSDNNQIDIVSSSTAWLSFKKFYLILNDTDYSGPRIHTWGPNFETNWACSPSMNSEGRSYTAEGATGDLYSYYIPSETTGMILRNAEGTIATQDRTIASSDNAAKFYEDESKDWLYSFSLTLIDNGPYLRGDWGTEGQSDWGWGEGGQLKMSGSGPYTVDDVPLSANGEIKMVIYNDGAITWTQPSEASGGTTDFPAERTGAGGNVRVEKDGLYNVSISLVSGDTYTYTLTGRADAYLTAATNFATAFVTDMYAGCPYNYSTGSYNPGKTSSTLATLWSTKVSAFGELDPKAQEYLNTNKGASVVVITNMWTSYEYVYGHYASVRAVDNADFLGRNPTEVASYANPLIALNNPVTSSATIAIVVVSIVSIVAVGGYFLLRRRKED